MCVCTYTLDGVGTGGPDEHWDPLVLLIGVDIQSHFVSGQAEGCDHLSDAAGEQVPEGNREPSRCVCTRVQNFNNSIIHQSNRRVNEAPFMWRNSFNSSINVQLF